MSGVVGASFTAVSVSLRSGGGRGSDLGSFDWVPYFFMVELVGSIVCRMRERRRLMSLGRKSAYYNGSLYTGGSVVGVSLSLGSRRGEFGATILSFLASTFCWVKLMRRCCVY